MTIWFSADHHFNHANIIKYCSRPFSSVQEMDTEMIGRWNSVVKPQDEVYYLGDLTMGNYGTARSYLKKMNGRIKFIEGNHDASWFRSLDINLRLPPIFELKINKQLIVLCHYGMREWNKSFHNSWHLYGHSHGNLPAYRLSFDVGVDTNDFYPYSLGQVSDKIDTLKNDMTP